MPFLSALFVAFVALFAAVLPAQGDLEARVDAVKEFQKFWKQQKEESAMVEAVKTLLNNECRPAAEELVKLLKHPSGAVLGAALEVLETYNAPETYQAWIDFGKHVSLEGGYRRTLFRSQMASGQAFTFDRTTFGRDEQLGISIDTLTADLDLVIKPINNRWVSLDLHLGSRYLFWRTEMQGNQADRTGRSTLEAAIPVVGAGLAVRPLRFLEIFARGRVGYLSYDRPESNTYRHGRRVDHVSAKEKTVKSAEFDVGVQVLIKDTIGVIAGWRADYFRFERGTDSLEEEARGMVYGAYVGVVLQF